MFHLKELLISTDQHAHLTWPLVTLSITLLSFHTFPLSSHISLFYFPTVKVACPLIFLIFSDHALPYFGQPSTLKFVLSQRSLHSLPLSCLPLPSLL